MSATSTPTALDSLTDVAGLQVVVRDQTPFLPKIAFTLISLASLAGVIFTSTHTSLNAAQVFLRWISLWSIGLAGGFAVWRVFYLRSTRTAPSDDPKVGALNETALARALLVGRWVAPITAVGAISALTTPYLNFEPVLKWGLFTVLIALTATLWLGIAKRINATITLGCATIAIALWAYADTAGGLDAAIRFTHLMAFSLWLGGALWNIAVAMPAGRAHPNVQAVVAGAGQLDRFRWVVRFALPIIIVTGIYMALSYRELPWEWWSTFPGVLLPAKVLTIVALVVVFITCPLFRHCSPVQGVCNIEDLEDGDNQ